MYKNLEAVRHLLCKMAKIKAIFAANHTIWIGSVQILYSSIEFWVRESAFYFTVTVICFRQ